MACGLSKSLCLSSSVKMQGITTILGSSDCDILSNVSSASSLRRTFSADLSSKNWISHNGISPMKRISSSEKLRAFGTNSLSFSDEEEVQDEEGLRSGSDIWAQIQQDKNKKIERPVQSDVWGSILTEKKTTDSNNTTDSPPYVHPLVKRASSLSEKSLEICTESLGSETGCEGFSSEIDNEINNQEEIKEEIMIPKLGQGSFPPPIPSLSTQSGSSLHMKTRRHDGRLVMEAVSMPSHTNFCAMRENGRLLLTFAEADKEIDSEEEEVTDSEEIENVYKFDGHKINDFQNLHRLVQKPIGPVTVHRLAHKPIGVPKRNSKWPVTDELDNKSIAQSLPPRPRVAQLARSMKPPSTVDDTVGAACFNNTCDYYWKPTKETEIEHTKTKTQFHNLVNKSEGWLNGCKEQRRSLLSSLEPFCIAT